MTINLLILLFVVLIVLYFYIEASASSGLIKKTGDSAFDSQNKTENTNVNVLESPTSSSEKVTRQFMNEWASQVNEFNSQDKDSREYTLISTNEPGADQVNGELGQDDTALLKSESISMSPLDSDQDVSLDTDFDNISTDTDQPPSIFTCMANAITLAIERNTFPEEFKTTHTKIIDVMTEND